MASTTRVPETEITGIYGGLLKSDDPQDARQGARARPG